jgi:hypothetical protein
MKILVFGGIRKRREPVAAQGIPNAIQISCQSPKIMAQPDHLECQRVL